MQRRNRVRSRASASTDHILCGALKSTNAVIIRVERQVEHS